jgi:hypothetical protein
MSDSEKSKDDLITELHILRQENGLLRVLNDKNTFIQAILDNLPIGLALNNIDDGQATFINKKFEEIYGWKSDELTSVEKFFERVYPDEEYRRLLLERIISDINTGDAEKMHWENISVTRKDGTRRIVNAVNIPLIRQNTMVSTVMDVTSLYQTQNDLIQAKERAEESDNLKKAFLNNISHEIRTPFNGILGFLSILQNDDLTPGEREQYISIINKSSYRLMNTVNDIVEIAQIHAGQLHLFKSQTNIASVTNELFLSFKTESEYKGLQFMIENNLPDEIGSILTDCNKLKAILSNLISNAIKFTQQGSIIVAVCAMDDFLEFSVSDTGIGIPRDKQHAIFERFVQVDLSNTRPFEGSGLGLSIAKAYVEKLGGSIRVESQTGEGSTFYFTVPYRKTEQQIRSSETIHKKSSPDNQEQKIIPSLKILIVEDDEGSATLLKVALRNITREIIKVKTGFEAVDACRNHRDLDLILMDIKIPGIDGYETTRQIRQFNAGVIIIAQTAFVQAGDIEKTLAAGCNDYISKPIVKEKLLVLLHKYFK